jgi:hypothetical protein
MGATMKTAISPFRQPKTEPNANSIHFLDEDLALVPASRIPEEFRKLFRFLPVIVLVPKSAVHDKTTQKKSRNPISPSLASSIPAMSAYRWMQRRLG